MTNYTLFVSAYNAVIRSRTGRMAVELNCLAY